MDELKNITYQSIVNYFKILPKTGYINDWDTNKLALLVCLYNMLDEFQGYINEEDMRQIYKIINCIGMTNCFVPQFSCKPPATAQRGLLDTPFRITEWTDLRDTQIITLRLINNLS